MWRPDQRRAEPARGGRHELHDADGADAGARVLAPAALLPGDGPHQGRIHAVARRMPRDQVGHPGGGNERAGPRPAGTRRTLPATMRLGSPMPLRAASVETVVP